jgi:uncharacterized membrane protein
MELHEALSQIAEIRQQVARTEVFRGYRAVPVAFSGLLAWTAAGLQALWITQPLDEIAAYLTLWVGAALVSMLATAVEMVMHYRLTTSPFNRAKTLHAVGQFVPSVVAGGLLMIVLTTYARDSVWMLPGLWAMLFGLGIFASFRQLPPATFWVAVYYLLAGCLCLAWANGEHALSPWAMGIPFGIGQFLSAAVLYWSLERNDDEE